MIPDQRSAFDPHAYEMSPNFQRTKRINDYAYKSLEFSVNGLQLPAALLGLMINGRWRLPSDASKLKQRFGNEINLYSLNNLPFENAHWIRETDSTWFGSPSERIPPGDIEPKKSVLIGDLGPGMDQPIALDYRRDRITPSVLLLEHEPANRWVQVASSIEDFAAQFGIE